MLEGTILGSIVGFLGALIPEVTALIREWIKSRAPQTQAPVPTEYQYGGITDGEYGVTSPDGDGPEIAAETRLPYVALDILRASVRPVITYAFFGLFVYIKLKAMEYAMSQQDAKIGDLLPVLWDESTATMFATVLAFWFGSRAIARWRSKS